MKTLKILCIVMVLALGCARAMNRKTGKTTGGVGLASPVAPVSAVPSLRARVLAVAAGEVGVREKTGQNDGARVQEYLASVGLKKGNPYCVAFIFWTGSKAVLKGEPNPFPRSAWSPDFVARPTWTQNGGGTLTPGDVLGFYFPSKGRIAHGELLEGKLSRRDLQTIGANTTGDGRGVERDGGGVHRVLRPLASVHSAKDWIGNN